jgi:hypothetical protein
MKHPVLLRMDESQYLKMHEAAQMFGESDQAFFLNAALLRMQTGLSPEKTDPFDDALLALRRSQASIPLSAEETAAVIAHREAIAEGRDDSVPAAQAVTKLKAMIAARRAKTDRI